MTDSIRTNRRHFIGAAAAAAGALAAPAIVRAQTRWKPERPITIYNPFAAGGVTDIHLRALSDRVAKILGQQVLIEAKPGAAGTLAPSLLLTAKPDGHTLACMAINSLRYPHYQQVSWNPLKDFTYVTGLSGYTMGIVVRKDAPWNAIEDLIAAGKAQPDKFTYGTSGVGGTGQLLMLEVEQTTGARFTHVPYKGGAEWMQALIAGDIDFLADAAQWAPFVDDGQCRILAMATEARIPKYPDKPTLRERGINAVAQSTYGLVGPKDLPEPIVQSLYEAFDSVNADPATQPILDKFIQVPWRKNPQQFRAFAEEYYVAVKPLLIKAGLAKG
ncbi:MAG: tripartite tricarboxylate transporter substrate binding protein [Burkholderiaceae bacterium]